MKNFWSQFKKPIIALAPMAGINDSAFRLICKQHGCDVVYSEMISVDALCHNSARTAEMLKFKTKERPVVFQLFGKDPELFVKAAKIVSKSGADGIDINFGCPARKIISNGAGAALMADLKLCSAIIEATIKATHLPVSIKIRTAMNVAVKNKKQTITAVDFVKQIKNLSVSAIMIHGRSYEQGFSGDINQIDFEMIRAVKEKFSGIVLANGGINTPEEAKLILDKTKADGIGLARGLQGNPWLSGQIKDFLTTGKYLQPSFAQIKKTAITHSELLYKAKGKQGLLEMRKHLAWYIKGFPQAAEWRKKLMTVKTLKEVKNIFSEIKVVV